jgi:hypothetical protein
MCGRLIVLRFLPQVRINFIQKSPLSFFEKSVSPEMLIKVARSDLHQFVRR